MSKNQSMNSIRQNTAAFTTLLYLDGEFLHLASHLERLFKGANYLFSKGHGFDDLGAILECLYALKLGVGSYKIKVILYKNYFEVETEKVLIKHSATIELELSKNTKKQTIYPSFLKMGDYRVCFIELEKHRKNSKNSTIDELIYFSPNGHLCDSTVSNIFLVDSKGVWTTPRTSSNVLEGIIRGKLIKFLNKMKIKIYEKDCTYEDLFNSKVIILTNSIRGARVVGRIGSKSFAAPLNILKIIDQFGRFGENYE